ncbi:nif-specific regulatory protein [bacterium BMS3Bbin12]|nr:nif-specific regulatory protein [bacterium BMS3Abin12]GBE47390.1 nif-specific regulatory protein [bacterium BMS3Bbin12]GBE49592.1 nif-specific regulatory protein [bacterium BMS3Bbin13]HDK02930.1 nif-specific transcriptional activator NifA [Gammaproteobacteria bacterium]
MTVKDEPVTDPSSLFETELEALYRVSRVLSRSLNLRETLRAVLQVLHDFAGMQRGMVTLLDPDSGDLLVSVVQSDAPAQAGSVRYRAGEGVVGAIIARGDTVVVRRIADEPRFLDRLGVYDPQLPFIGVPIRVGEGSPVGVLAAQPQSADVELLSERGRFLEMVANLTAQTVRLSWEVERERRDLADERDQLRRAVRGEHGFSSVVGHTPTMRKVFDQVRQVAKWNTTVLIRGESGTGKELVANAIHYNSPRASNAFVKLNSAALPDTLLESELFGHEKGAFTGATTQRKGRFERADGGTLFLDEIGEISGAFQAKLLRVLQEGEFERVGGTRTLKVDVRIIAATNRDLEREVEKGEFREDLYYRLNVMSINMPPLRSRQEDIPDLARFLATKIGRRQERKLEVTDSAIRLLMRHGWPGNVRELENCLERAAIMSGDGLIDRDAIVQAGIEDGISATGGPASPPPAAPGVAGLDERERVIAALEQAGWVQAKAARLLGMTPRQIAYRIQTLDINVRKI